MTRSGRTRQRLRPKKEYQVKFDHRAREQFLNGKNVPKQFQDEVLRRMEDRLRYEPTRHNPTGKRGMVKRLRDNDIGEFQCDVGTYRFIYDVLDYPEREVVIRAVGMKRRERLFIDGSHVILEVVEQEEAGYEDN